jgi:hypothetical protein
VKTPERENVTADRHALELLPESDDDAFHSSTIVVGNGET